MAKIVFEPHILELYQALALDLSRLELSSYDALGQALVEFSPFPMTTCLKLASFYKDISGVLLSKEEEFLEMSERYTDCALTILKELESDHLACMMLHVPTDFGSRATAIRTAINTENKRFVKNPK